MEALILIFPLSYLVLNVLYGIVFMMPYYLIKEKNRIVDKREFLYILLFPSVGLGYWTYNRLARKFGPPELPRRWHIWRNMSFVHLAYLIMAVLAFYILLLNGFSGGGGGGGYGDFIVALFSAFAALFMLVILGLVFLLVAIAMLLLPLYVANSIKANHYAQQHKTY